MVARCRGHHGLSAARDLWCVLLLLPLPLLGAGQHDGEDDNEDGEEQPHQDARYGNRPVVVAVPGVQFAGDHALGGHLPVGTGPTLTTVQTNVQDVGASVALLANLPGHIPRLIGRPLGSRPVHWHRVSAPHQRVELQASLPDPPVGVLPGPDRVDGVDVPFPPSRHLQGQRGQLHFSSPQFGKLIKCK